jgi:hypothetical protein
VYDKKAADCPGQNNPFCVVNIIFCALADNYISAFLNYIVIDLYICVLIRMPYILRELALLFFFFKTGVLIEGFRLSKQVLCCLSHFSSPFCSGYFGDGVT